MDKEMEKGGRGVAYLMQRYVNGFCSINRRSSEILGTALGKCLRV